MFLPGELQYSFQKKPEVILFIYSIFYWCFRACSQSIYLFLRKLELRYDSGKFYRVHHKNNHQLFLHHFFHQIQQRLRFSFSYHRYFVLAQNFISFVNKYINVNSTCNWVQHTAFDS